MSSIAGKRYWISKNRSRDYGSYIYDGKLNFYDFSYRRKSPRCAPISTYITCIRGIFETKVIKMYINGLSKVEFKDKGTERMLDADQVLNFSGRPYR